MAETLKDYLSINEKLDVEIQLYVENDVPEFIKRIIIATSIDDTFKDKTHVLTFNINEKDKAKEFFDYEVLDFFPWLYDCDLPTYEKSIDSIAEKIEKFIDICKIVKTVIFVLKKSDSTEQIEEKKDEPKKSMYGGIDFDAASKELDALLNKKPKEEKEKPKEEKPEEPIKEDVSSILDGLFDDSSTGEDNSSGEEVDFIKTSIELQNQLRKTVFGQDFAINAFVSGFFESEMKAKLFKDINKPRAIFLFAGAPGSGKTFLAEEMSKLIGRPFLKLDMSSYPNESSNLDIVGTDPSYKNPSPGILTNFVKKNPKSIVLFDEIEKANISVLHQIYQLLDSGKLLDNYYGKVINFNECILIFTSNVGRSLYEDTEADNLSHFTKKTILKAIGEDVNPKTNAELFPQALISRFASGHVVLFNKHNVNNLLKIVNREIIKIVNAESKLSNVNVNVDENVANVVIYSEGNTIDARSIQGKANHFVYCELFELYKMLLSKNIDVKNIKTIDFKVEIPENGAIKDLFVQPSLPTVLVFSSDNKFESLSKKISNVNLVNATTISKAKKLLAEQDFDLIICDIKYQVDKDHEYLNLEDIDSLGKNFFDYVCKYSTIPISIMLDNENEIIEEEKYSFMSVGALGFLFKNSDTISDDINDICFNIYKQKQSNKLVKENKVLVYKSLQTISKDKQTATIQFYNFKFELAMDANESKDVLVDVSKPNVKLDDVIGAEDAKEEIKYFIEYLKNPKKYVHMGVKQPKGVLLYGPPGTGKTMLAKAMAAESGVSFVKAEGNQFLKKYVGEGPQAIHDIFNRARKFSPAILFIDEIDAIATSRNSAQSTNSSSILTALLTEMDGFNKNNDKPVFVLAATNYSIDPNNPNSLDSALLRRFDKKIFIDVPNKDDRRKYLQMASEKNDAIKVSKEEIESICIRSTGMSLADLENVIEASLRDAIKNKKCIVTDEILDSAFEEYWAGKESKHSEESLKRVAIHESGHALINILSGEIPAYLTIISRGDHGGYMLHDVKEEVSILTKNELINRIRVSLAGKAAEEIYYGPIEGASTGPSGDLENATWIAKNMICSFGMDEDFGLASIDIDNNKSSSLYQIIINKVNELLSREFENTKQLINENKNLMDEIIDVLLSKNYLNKEELSKLCEKYKK